MHTPLETLAQRAIAGHRDAMEALLTALQPTVYGLSVRMLGSAHDAEDATQEILVRVLTRLATFEGRSQLRSWVYRIASNYLLDQKRRPTESLTFEGFAEDLAQGATDEHPEGERSMLVEEVRIGCTLALLQCLDRGHRLAYILGEVLALSPGAAADALELDPPAFRKRLQRARDKVEEFTRTHCGLVSDQAACRCPRRLDAAVRLGRARPGYPTLAQTPSSFVEARALIRRADDARRVVELYRRSSPRPLESDLARRLVGALETAPRSP